MIVSNATFVHIEIYLVQYSYDHSNLCIHDSNVIRTLKLKIIEIKTCSNKNDSANLLFVKARSDETI